MGEDSEEARENYEQVFNIILETQKKMLGDKVALKYARKTPLEIDASGELQDFYGDGESVLEIVLEQYEQVWGEDVADRKIGRKLKEELPEEDHDLLPQDLRDVEPRKGALTQLKEKVLG